jgi:hypothetical protein
MDCFLLEAAIPAYTDGWKMAMSLMPCDNACKGKMNPAGGDRVAATSHHLAVCIQLAGKCGCFGRTMFSPDRRALVVDDNNSAFVKFKQ